MNNVIIFCAKDLIIFFPLVISWLFFQLKGRQRTELALSVALAGIVAFILLIIFQHLYNNPRPFVSDGTPALVKHGNDNGFPSEHSILAMSLATIILLYRRRIGAVAVVLAVLVAWGRVAAHVHHAVDVFAGLAVGAFAGYIGFELAKRLTPGAKNGAVDHKSDNPVASVNPK